MPNQMANTTYPKKPPRYWVADSRIGNKKPLPPGWLKGRARLCGRVSRRAAQVRGESIACRQHSPTRCDRVKFEAWLSHDVR